MRFPLGDGGDRCIAAFSVPVANATTLTLDDLSESPTFTDTDFPGTQTLVDGPNPPIDAFVNGSFPAVDVRFIFLEPGSTTLVSDIVHLTVALHAPGLTDVTIEFQSDRETPLAMPAPLPIDEILTEFGTFQTLYSAT